MTKTMDTGRIMRTMGRADSNDYDGAGRIMMNNIIMMRRKPRAMGKSISSR